MRFYRLLGKIVSITRWPFAWPVLLFKRKFGKRWYGDEHDDEWAGALILQFVWMLILVLLIGTISAYLFSG